MNEPWGIGQFLDIGTGIPTSPNVHKTAADCAADTRVVYVDNDPVIHAHANALFTGTGSTKIVLADVRDPQQVLAGARGFLDFTRPVALLLIAIVHFVPDACSVVHALPECLVTQGLVVR